jgi:glycosyltransferase involved in cell wall biosynthesis
LARYFFELWRHLPAAGVGFRGLVVGSSAVGTASGGTVTSFSPVSAPLIARLWRARRAAADALRSDPQALLVSHFALYTFPFGGPRGGKLRRRPLVVHFQGPWALEGTAERGSRTRALVKHAVERAVYDHATVFVVLSEAFGRILVERYDVPRDRIRVIPGGADVDRFADVPSRADARRALGWPADRPIVLTVRRLVRRMGLDTLVEAAASIRRAIPDALVMICGAGRLRADLERSIEAQGLADGVRLAGFIPDDKLPLAYRAADLSVVPSVALEGFGLVAAESLAAGTAVMVTPVGGLPEVVAGLAPQCVLAGTSANDLAEGIVGALTGMIALPTADACQRFARERYAWPTIARQLRDVYAGAYAGAGP